MSIAKKHNLYVLPQWDMEFTVKNSDYYFKTIETAKLSNLPLSRLYYWNITDTLQENNEQGMLCTMPLIDSNGCTFGVCGLEVSSMLFKQSYLPNNNLYENIFCVFSKLDQKQLKISKSLIAGNYYQSYIKDDIFSIRYNKNNFNSYYQGNSLSFLGLHQAISLYTKNSPYNNENWVITVMMSEKELHKKTSSQNTKTILLLAILMILGIIGSSIISRKYISPVINAISQLLFNSKYFSPFMNILA